MKTSKYFLITFYLITLISCGNGDKTARQFLGTWQEESSSQCKINIIKNGENYIVQCIVGASADDWGCVDCNEVFVLANEGNLSQIGGLGSSYIYVEGENRIMLINHGYLDKNPIYFTKVEK